MNSILRFDRIRRAHIAHHGTGPLPFSARGSSARRCALVKVGLLLGFSFAALASAKRAIIAGAFRSCYHLDVCGQYPDRPRSEKSWVRHDAVSAVRRLISLP